MTTVWLARHGEAHNPSELLYGRLPRVRLSPEGRRQAQALADFLAPRPLAAIYSSPMLRARRTADAVLATRTDLTRIPPVGTAGRSAEGLAPLGTFLGLDPHEH